MDYDVLDALRVALASSDEPDPRVVAQQVAAEVQSRYLRDALAQVLVAHSLVMASRLADDPAVVQLGTILDGLTAIEAVAVKQLERTMAAEPLGPWVQSTKGVGLKQAARLLAAIGDPYWHSAENRPRLVSELWSYCGFSVVDGAAPRARKGEKARWSWAGRSRTRLIIDSCVKIVRPPCAKESDDAKWVTHTNDCVCSPYRVIYDEGRRKYADAVDENGQPLIDARKDNRARRLAAKALLRDLWLASRDLHGAPA